MSNPYIPFASRILDVKKHTQKEYTFRMEYHGEVKPGQFLRFLFRNSEKRLFLSAESETVT